MTLKNFIGKEVDQYSKHKKAIIFVIFLLVVSSLVYFAFFEGKITSGIITSRIIGSSGEINPENSINISANLIQPDDLIIKGKIDKIEMKINKIDDFFYAGTSKFDLGQLSETYIIIFDYNGELSFDNENILKLKGKSSEVLINGVSTTPTSGDDMKIYFDNDIGYGYLKAINIFLSPLSYTTSGSINLNDGKININIDEEEVKLGKFRGDIEVDGREFKIKGETEKLEVVGILDIKI
ncbi:hypothetical protein ES703_87412 [subsurface metagenome]